MSVPTARAPADGNSPPIISAFTPTPPHLYLYLPSYFQNPPISSPPSLYPSIYSFLLSLSLYPLPPLPLPLSLYPSTSPHSSYLSAFSPSFLSTSVLYFLTPPLFLFTLIEPFTPPFTLLLLHSSISLHPSTSLPLSLFLPLVTLLFVPSISFFFPLSALSNLAPRFIVP